MNQEITKFEPGALGVRIRSELEGEIEAARRFPRDLEAFTGRIVELVTRSPEIAAEMRYVIPRDGKLIEGGTIRFAEAILSVRGNARVASRITEETHDHVTAQGIFHDLETNVTISKESTRRIVDKRGRRYGPDMITMTANAAASIAMRNAILAGIPRAEWEPALEAAKRAASASDKPLPELRQSAIKAFAPYAVTESRILKMLGRQALEQVTADDIVKLRGVFSAIKEGETTAGEVFPLERQSTARAEPTIEEFVAGREPGELGVPEAFELGREAKAAGKSATPPEDWSDQAMIDAWLAGYDSEEASQ